jgi:hypothetical protein
MAPFAISLSNSPLPFGKRASLRQSGRCNGAQSAPVRVHRDSSGLIAKFLHFLVR